MNSETNPDDAMDWAQFSSEEEINNQFDSDSDEPSTNNENMSFLKSKSSPSPDGDKSLAIGLSRINSNVETQAPKIQKQDQPAEEMIRSINERPKRVFINVFDVHFEAQPQELRKLYPDIKINKVRQVKDGNFLFEFDSKEEAIKLVNAGSKSVRDRKFHIRMGFPTKEIIQEWNAAKKEKRLNKRRNHNKFSQQSPEANNGNGSQKKNHNIQEEEPHDIETNNKSKSGSNARKNYPKPTPVPKDELSPLPKVITNQNKESQDLSVTIDQTINNNKSTTDSSQNEAISNHVGNGEQGSRELPAPENKNGGQKYDEPKVEQKHEEEVKHKEEVKHQQQEEVKQDSVGLSQSGEKKSSKDGPNASPKKEKKTQPTKLKKVYSVKAENQQRNSGNLEESYHNSEIQKSESSQPITDEIAKNKPAELPREATFNSPSLTSTTNTSTSEPTQANQNKKPIADSEDQLKSEMKISKAPEQNPIEKDGFQETKPKLKTQKQPPEQIDEHSQNNQVSKPLEQLPKTPQNKTAALPNQKQPAEQDKKKPGGKSTKYNIFSAFMQK